MVGESPIPPAPDTATNPRASFEQASQHLNQAREFAGIYVAAQAARLRVSIRNALLFGLLAMVAVIVIATFAVVSVVLACEGAAGGIGALLGGRNWAGELIVGGVVLCGAAAVSWYSISYIRKVSRRQTISSYLKSKIPGNGRVE